MVGPPAKLKVAIWDSTTSKISAPTTPTGFVGRMLRPLLTLINSMLGSLAQVFPPLEVVVEEQHHGTPPPGAILNLQ